MAPPPRAFPAHSLEKALVIIEAIVDKGGSKPMDRLLVADAIGRTPSSSEFKRLLSSSRAYGLTSGTEKAEFVAPTELGLKIKKPIHPQEALEAKVRACLTVDILGKVYRSFNKQKLPDAKFLKNTLERTYKLESGSADELAALVVENAKYCGILQDISGSKYIRMDEPSLSSTPSNQENDDALDGDPIEAPMQNHNAFDANAVTPQIEKKPKLFLAHGKNQKPLNDLKKILEGFGIQFVVAVDEPHAGRPISSKVAGLMEECTAGIFIFTKDEAFLKKTADSKNEEVWRPSENVVYELGAASILWDQKIIILKEEGVSFPSDFSDLGYITFKEGEISAKAMEIMKELIAFKLLKLQAA